ncbi:hypothetical protein HME9302_02597 [Alteripontixanthobacter maritimus]|uniref:Uncharacterized protein n=1 Tax=Alteripontixanthobacter maritimus TaxID=2161824 RepID=A0A369QCT0_9SPHN|nr:hypothetical protein HME9302_02597 [Alteripontixanthobacter maritimus]
MFALIARWQSISISDVMQYPANLDAPGTALIIYRHHGKHGLVLLARKIVAAEHDGYVREVALIMDVMNELVELCRAPFVTTSENSPNLV